MQKNLIAFCLEADSYICQVVCQLTFSARFGNCDSSASFLSRVIKLLIYATLSLPHPASQAPFSVFM